MNPFFDSNCYRPNFDSSPQGFYTFADYGSSPQPHGFTQLSQDEVVPETQLTTNVGPSTQPKQKRRHRRKQAADTEPAVGGSSRIEKWTTEEEFQLTKAWIDVSEDPIVGRNQKGPDFWSKIRNQFFQAMGRGEYRTNDMLSSKWRDMNLKVRKFNGIYSQKWQTRRSGQSDAMIEREAEEQYREEFNAHFSLQRSWELMRKCPNWIRLETVQSSASKRSKTSSTDSPGTSDARVNINLNYLDEEEEDDDNEIEDLTRPIGRDRAKADQARARRGSSSQTTPDYNQGIEQLSQRIGDFNELKRECQRLVELQLLFTNTEHLTGLDREIAEREKDKIRNKYRDN
ncbi:hypothetical protein E3N88_11251 [Mikania micrantha]|uniref:No apical meristem-associated C-terminal domain-containing protein n=1 Tax=Mikania micrantha TaxID=192012 RepID=A0A5N6PCV2_9ASTR|nr:hypothetical protein E3N88_43225 [Mikania micrantha]KAD6119980.1 hypothetical protein E3N88_11251 [Mikania micrantha]